MIVLVALFATAMLFLVSTLLICLPRKRYTPRPDDILAKFDYFGEMANINDCSSHRTHCFTNSDCINWCSNKNVFMCFNNLCIPKQTFGNRDCNQKTGGMFVYSTNPLRTGFTCVCRYPNYFAGPACDELAPEVCQGGTFNYSKLNIDEGPLPKHCKCPQPTTRVTIKSSASLRAVPLCLTAAQYKVLQHSGVGDLII